MRAKPALWPLTVTIIARNEADRIGEAIRSAGFADEVVVLDSGSNDATVEVARSLGARVVLTDWPGHVAQKNRALDEASHDWVLSIDADERVSPELATEIAAIRTTPPPVSGYRMSRLSWWEGRPIRHGAWYPDSRVRLFDRRKGRWIGRDPHDRVQVGGPVGSLSGELHHHPHRDLGEQVRKLDDYARIWAEGALRDGVIAHWWDVVLRPPLHFVKAILLKAGFLDGRAGFVIASLDATYVLLKWTRIWLGAEAK